MALYVHLPGYAETVRGKARCRGPRPDGAPEKLLEATLEAEAPAACMAAERRECAMAAYVALSQHRGGADAGQCREEALVAALMAAGTAADDAGLNNPDKLRAYVRAPCLGRTTAASWRRAVHAVPTPNAGMLERSIRHGMTHCTVPPTAANAWPRCM